MTYIELNVQNEQVTWQLCGSEESTSETYMLDTFGKDNKEQVKELSKRLQKSTSNLEGIVCIGDVPSRYRGTCVQVNGVRVDFAGMLEIEMNLPVITMMEDNLLNAFERRRNEVAHVLSYYGYEGGKFEKSKESLLTIGNGYFGVRGAYVSEKAGTSNYPATYIAGLYNKVATRVADVDVWNEDFVNTPNASYITFSINGGEPFSMATAKIHETYRTLDVRNGEYVAYTHATVDREYEVEIQTRKVAPMQLMHTYGIEYTVTPLNFDGEITICTELDGDIINAGVDRYASLTSLHLEHHKASVENGIPELCVTTTQSQVEVALRSVLTLANAEFSHNIQEKSVRSTCVCKGVKGKAITLTKVVYVGTSKELPNVCETLRQITDVSVTYADLRVRAAKDMEALLAETRITVKGDMISQKLLLLHNYHMLVSCSPLNEQFDASITARGLHGEAYRGHIFWDEIFLLPFYDIHFPRVAKNLLMYRYNRLPEARKYAEQHGYRGAMFPWQSGSTGEEETQTLHLNPLTGKWGDDYSSFQRHVSLAVAYNVWQYYSITEDIEFLESYGLELLLDVARFWLSKSELNTESGRYDIKNVMGPDEFHESYPSSDEGGLTNNAYTNMMVVWLFETVQELRMVCSKEAYDLVSQKLSYTVEEFDMMEEVKKKLTLEINDESIIAQYQGYFDLKELNFEAYREKYTNIYRMDRLLKAEGKSADDYKVAKQADTLMTFYNLPPHRVNEILHDLSYDVSDDYIQKNLMYYLARTSHGSTLSRVVHAQLAQIVEDRELAWSLYRDALGSDFFDIQGGTTAEGIHTGVMGATMLVSMYAFGGIDLRSTMLSIMPSLPNHWEVLETQFTFKGTRFEVSIAHDHVEITADRDVDVNVYGILERLQKGIKQRLERSK